MKTVGERPASQGPQSRPRLLIALVLIAAGSGLAALKIVEDGEPGALPLALIVAGVALGPLARLRRTSQDA